MILPFVLGSSECDIHFNFDKKDPFSGKICQSGLVFRQTTLDILFDSVTFHNIDFIKMDVEGFELSALKGAAETIGKYKPKLAISLYHKPEDFLEIPMYLKSKYPFYRFYLDHYTIHNEETVLYATAN